jgi:hypothetical protein
MLPHGPDLVADLKRKGLERLIYVIRMDETKVTKNFFETKPEVRRNVGRSKLTCYKIQRMIYES